MLSVELCWEVGVFDVGFVDLIGSTSIISLLSKIEDAELLLWGVVPSEEVFLVKIWVI